MKKQKYLRYSIFMLMAFLLWTAAVCFVDTQAIGPQGSSVGLARINSSFHELTGVHMSLYAITDILGLVPLGFVIGFVVLGLIQWCKRKQLLRIDYSILALGVFYIVVATIYILFEVLVVNYRPILIDGALEASYPSSTTMLVMCVMQTAIIQLDHRIKNGLYKSCIVIAISAFIAFMVIGRLVSGVHWLSDVIGSAILSSGLVMMYRFVCDIC